jgi:hypothetical protein
MNRLKQSTCDPSPASIHANIVAKQKCTFVIVKAVVDDIIGDLLLKVEARHYMEQKLQL